MRIWLREFFKEILAVFKGTFYKSLYKRTGDCNQCGKCCRHVYLRSEGKYIATFDDYFKLVAKDVTMKRFRPKGRDNQGLLFFSCEYISQDDRCLDYENRPEMCRVYPSLSMLRHGATPKEDCSYRFVNRLTGKEVTA